MQTSSKLAPHEALVVEVAHAEAGESHRHIDAMLQIKLSGITNRRGIAEGTEIRFVKNDDSTISLEWDDGARVLKLFDENGISKTPESSTANHDEEDGS